MCGNLAVVNSGSGVSPVPYSTKSLLERIPTTHPIIFIWVSQILQIQHYRFISISKWKSVAFFSSNQYWCFYTSWCSRWIYREVDWRYLGYFCRWQPSIDLLPVCSSYIFQYINGLGLLDMKHVYCHWCDLGNPLLQMDKTKLPTALPAVVHTMIHVKVTLDIFGCPIENQWGSREYPG